ncbi:hypothetical protein ES702_02210 [subsurface metagenome]
MAWAYCSICGKSVETVPITPERVRAKLWLVPLKCGHIFNWETGKCYNKNDFPIISLQSVE